MQLAKCIIESANEKKNWYKRQRCRCAHKLKEEIRTMAKQKSTAVQPSANTLKKKGLMYYLKRDWQLYALMLLPMLFIIVFKYLAYTGLSVAFLDYKIGKGYAGSKFVGLEIFKKVFKHRDFTKAVVNTLLLNVLDLLFSFPMPMKRLGSYSVIVRRSSNA